MRVTTSGLLERDLFLLLEFTKSVAWIAASDRRIKQLAASAPKTGTAKKKAIEHEFVLY
jgi:hypothetical protein